MKERDTGMLSVKYKGLKKDHFYDFNSRKIGALVAVAPFKCYVGVICGFKINWNRIVTLDGDIRPVTPDEEVIPLEYKLNYGRRATYCKLYNCQSGSIIRKTIDEQLLHGLVFCENFIYWFERKKVTEMQNLAVGVELLPDAELKVDCKGRL